MAGRLNATEEEPFSVLLFQVRRLWEDQHTEVSLSLGKSRSSKKKGRYMEKKIKEFYIKKRINIKYNTQVKKKTHKED